MTPQAEASRSAALPDLDLCAREPIHIPGAIQPHGVLLCIDASSEKIIQASDNAAQLLGLNEDQVIGSSWRDVLNIPLSDDEGERPWHSAWMAADFPLKSERPLTKWNAAVHAYDAHWVIELEPQTNHFDEDPIRQSYELTRQLEHDATVEKSCSRMAKRMSQLLGYDRVMIYRFDHHWNGEVVAEAIKKESNIEPYLGLNYPATDIPAQARALYLRNRVRAIGNVVYVPSTIVPADNPQTHEPLDLSDVAVRSVSPVHLEYLSNMGVTGTLVASIIVHGRLWGLIACHHYSPRYADYRVRDFTDMAARALASRVGTLEALAQVEQESDLLTLREKLITALNESERVTPQLLGKLVPELLEAVEADGVAIFSGEGVRGFGGVPAAADLLRIRARMASRPDAQEGIAGVIQTDSLEKLFPELSDLSPLASGVVYMPLITDAHYAVLWLRHERVRDVRWAGNPHLSKLETIPGARLSPRQSFASWRETVRGYARPWSQLHLESARGLRVVIELMERKHYQQNFALMRASVERIDKAVFLVEADSALRWYESEIAFANAAFARKAGSAASSLQGKRVMDLLQTLPDSHRGEDSDQSFYNHQADDVSVLLKTSDGSERRLSLNIEAVTDQLGSVTHWMAMERDRDNAAQ